jgi:hypothetical protein
MVVQYFSSLQIEHLRLAPSGVTGLNQLTIDARRSLSEHVIKSLFDRPTYVRSSRALPAPAAELGLLIFPTRVVGDELVDLSRYWVETRSKYLCQSSSRCAEVLCAREGHS